MEKVDLKRFNVRVYGLLIQNGNVLVTDEVRMGTSMTKFPGGGLEFNEGIGDGLKREFVEELNVEVELDELFYINDFLQVSKFAPEDQLLSIYYKVNLVQGDIPTVKVPFEFTTEEPQCFRWVPIKDLKAEIFTFPIDKVVANKLKA